MTSTNFPSIVINVLRLAGVWCGDSQVYERASYNGLTSNDVVESLQFKKTVDVLIKAAEYV